MAKSKPKSIRTEHWLKKYPWEKWLNGKKHTVIPGEDFTCSERAFSVYLYRKAKAEKKRVEIHSVKDSKLTIQFFDLANGRKKSA